MPSVAIATCSDHPELHEDDVPFAAALKRRGCTVAPKLWDDPNVAWNAFDRVVIRSTWGYHETPEQYRRWLESFRNAPGRLWNPPDAVLANIHKEYLLDLERAGVPIVPTVLTRAGEDVALDAILAQQGWSRAVAKPAISAGAMGTWRVHDDQTERPGPGWLDLATASSQFREAASQHDMLIQPYLDELAASGEWSLVFLGGRFSHALLKTPAKGDFRVQTEHGGAFRSTAPPAAFIEQAERAMSVVDSPLLYARVDGVERDGVFLLMELEINEPYLGFLHAPGSADRLADALLATIEQ